MKSKRATVIIEVSAKNFVKIVSNCSKLYYQGAVLTQTRLVWQSTVLAAFENWLLNLFELFKREKSC